MHHEYKSKYSHETLDCYRLAVEVARWIAKLGLSGALRDQAIRASQSVVLNIAEGCGRGGKSRQNHLRIARGSASEVCAVLDLVEHREAEAYQAKLRRIGMMLNAMI